MDGHRSEDSEYRTRLIGLLDLLLHFLPLPHFNFTSIIRKLLVRYE